MLGLTAILVNLFVIIVVAILLKLRMALVFSAIVATGVATLTFVRTVPGLTTSVTAAPFLTIVVCAFCSSFNAAIIARFDVFVAAVMS